MDWAQLIEVRELCMCAEYRMLPDTFLTVHTIQYIHTYIQIMFNPLLSSPANRCIGEAAIATANLSHTRD